MFSNLYFAVASALSAADKSPAYARQALAGQFTDAYASAAAWADPDGSSRDGDYAAMLAYGDIQLALGRSTEAEETYRKAQRLIRHSRDLMRVVSCRNAGWLAFFQNRFGTALTCFKRVGDEAEATLELRMESLLGEALVLHHLGCLNTISAHLDSLAALAAQARDTRWVELAAALRRDLMVQYHVRSGEELHDHIYWRSTSSDFLTAELGSLDAPVSQVVAKLAALTQRLEYLEHLRAFAGGRADACERLDAHLQWAARAGLADYHRSLCLEVAVAAIAAKAPNTSETMLNQCRVTNAQASQHERWYLEYVYCLSKVRQRQGRIQEFAQMYGRYALASIQHVRADSVSMTPAAAPASSPARAAASQPKSDDVSARLPGKYRRAYRYMMEHLDQRDLSVRELAAHIGVTERAIQAAFKTHLGLSPSQLIRRQRMERIHAELSSEDGAATSVLEVANKWGVQHRSTLVNGYRKIFNEAPSETLAR